MENTKALKAVSLRSASLSRDVTPTPQAREDSLIKIVEGQTVDLVPIGKPKSVLDKLKRAGKNERVVHTTIARVPASELSIIKSAGNHLDRARLVEKSEIILDALRKAKRHQIEDFDYTETRDQNNLSDSVSFEGESDTAVVYIDTDQISAGGESHLLLEDGNLKEGLVEVEAPASKIIEFRRAIAIVVVGSDLSESLRGITPVNRLANREIETLAIEPQDEHLKAA